MRVWYRVGDLDRARVFYTDTLGFLETAFDDRAGWSQLERGEMKIGVMLDDPGGQAVASIDVLDVKAEFERLRRAGVEVGTVLELAGTMRLLDVYDPDGNRIQLQQDL